MRTVSNYRLGNTWQPGHYNPSRTVEYWDRTGKHSVMIGAGPGDRI